MSVENVSSAYRMLSDARARFANRILIRPTGDGVEAVFCLERGWIVYKAWSKQESEALWESIRTIGGLTIDPARRNEQSEIRLRIKGEWIHFLFDIRWSDSGLALMILVKPDYPILPYYRFDTLGKSLRDAIGGIFSERRPTGIILINAFDERQRNRMVYGILSALSDQKLDMVSLESHHYFRSDSIRQIILSLTGDKPILTEEIHSAEVIAIPTPLMWDFTELFQLAGDRLFVIGFDFANSHLAIRSSLEEVKIRSIVADRLRAVWTGRRVDLTCRSCGGVVDPQRGDSFAQLCPECDGYGRVRGTDLFEVVIPDAKFRERISSDRWWEGLIEEVERVTIPKSIVEQLEEGIAKGELFSAKRKQERQD